MSLNVNGRVHELTLDPRVSVLDALRDHLGITSAKKGCDHGQCGACTVLLDGRRVVSCLCLAVSHDGATVVTAEGLGQAGGLHPLQQALIDHDGLQCGYCTPARPANSPACSRSRLQGGAAGRRYRHRRLDDPRADRRRRARRSLRSGQAADLSSAKATRSKQPNVTWCVAP